MHPGWSVLLFSVRMQRSVFLASRLRAKAKDHRQTQLMRVAISATFWLFFVSEATVLLDFSLTVKAATLIFIFGRFSAISSAKQGTSGSFYNLVKN